MISLSFRDIAKKHIQFCFLVVVITTGTVILSNPHFGLLDNSSFISTTSSVVIQQIPKTEKGKGRRHSYNNEKASGAVDIHHHMQYSDDSTAADESLIPSVSIGVDYYGHDVRMPLVGAGTWQYNDSVAYESVCQAFQAGYTMVDTAYGYRNQKGVGRAIRDCWKRPRSELFVLTKLPGGLNHDEVWATHLQNMRELQLDYVDHLMTHFPADWAVSPDRATPERRQEGWRALQEIYETGAVRSIGISHYCTQHIDDILQVSDVVTPSINQVEYHVGSGDVDHVMAHCQKHNITFMSFSPLCGPCHYEHHDSLITGDLVTEIASRYENVTGAQVALRFIVQQALQDSHDKNNNNQQPTRMGGVIPKSNNIHHMKLNRDIFRFSLTKEDMARLRLATKPPAETGDCTVP